MNVKFILFVYSFLLISVLPGTAQTWNWGKRNLVIEGLNTNPIQSCIDSRGNTLVLSHKGDRQILSKHDEKGIMIWKRELFFVTMTLNSQTKLCVDASDNIYLAIAALNKIDNIVFTSPSPHGIIKLNSSGRFIWWRSILHSYSTFIFAPQLIANGNDIFVVLPILNFESITYNGIVYSNAGNNSRCGWLARLDTSGIVQWSRRIYSPPFGSCSVWDARPHISVNTQNQLLLTGSATGKLLFETIPAIDYPYTCRPYTYGAVLNGTSGSIQWAKELVFDTLATKTKMSILERNTFSTILSNGEVVMYRMISRDTPLTSFTNKLDAISSKLYLFDVNGNLKLKDSTGTVETGWHEIYQLASGDAASYFSSGVKQSPYAGSYIYEAAKWDTTLKAVWKKNTESAISAPWFSPLQFYYRNNKLSVLLQSDNRSPSHQGFYTYFGADSLLPVNEFMFARMLDSASVVAGTAFFDQNQNGTKELSEPPAPGLIISDSSGSIIYAVTDKRGYYEIPVGAGWYTFKLLNLSVAYPNHTIVSPAEHHVPVIQTTYLRNKNFALRSSANILDGQINITPYTVARPGGVLWSKIQITNPGTQAYTSTYTITYDTSKMIFYGSILVPGNLTSTRVSYINKEIVPGDSLQNDVGFAIKTTAKAGDTLRVYVELITSSTDILKINNRDSVTKLVVSSFDPNDKQVYPLKHANFDSVRASKHDLDYTIRFQNTGNDTAFTVLIADSLDSKLDYSTFKLIAASHPVNVIWAKAGFTGFIFKNILLPDSNTNKEGSNGFVRFKIKPKANVFLSDIISNKASIYFDYNEPIQTNEVTTSFIHNITTSIPNLTTSDQQLIVWPVPFQDVINVKLKNTIPGEVLFAEVYDAAGRIVFSKSQATSQLNGISFNLATLNVGTYYLVVSKSASKRYVRQIVKH